MDGKERGQGHHPGKSFANLEPIEPRPVITREYVDHAGRTISKSDLAGGFISIDQHDQVYFGERKYLPTLSDLVDRLAIAMQKFIFLPGHEGEYQQEIDDLRHDVRLICGEKVGELVYGVIAVTLANRCIWENETHIRDGSSTEPADIQLQRLRKTHSVNGVRNTAKNFIAALYGGRKDYKIDMLAADLPPEFGNWKLF